jgi:hypothetical protein
LLQLHQGVLPPNPQSRPPKIRQGHCQVQGRPQTHQQRVQDCFSQFGFENRKNCLNNRQRARPEADHGVLVLKIGSTEFKEPGFNARRQFVDLRMQRRGAVRRVCPIK